MKDKDEIEKIFYEEDSKLLCIEEKVIDEMIKKNKTGKRHCLSEYGCFAYAGSINALELLKSKMKPINIKEERSKTWDAAVRETISCAEYKEGQEEIPYNFPKMLDRKTKYLNGE